MKNLAFLILVLLLGATDLLAKDRLKVEMLEQWSNVFGGQESVYHCSINAPQEFTSTAKWNFDVSGRTVARREQSVSPAPGKPEVIELKLAIPPVKAGVVMQGTLVLNVYGKGKEKPDGSLEKKLWIFSHDPFADRSEWLKAFKIELFDPEKKTAALFEEAGVPFKLIGNVDAIGADEGLIIIGEGVSLKDYRGLSEVLFSAASKGRTILCLAMAGGELLLPGFGDADLPAPKRMTFARNDIIETLDKRLDADAWAPDGKVASGSMKLTGARGPVSAEMLEGGSGWTWAELTYGKRGHIVFCGFGIIEKWGSGPTPRYLFASILEYLDKNGCITKKDKKEK